MLRLGFALFLFLLGTAFAQAQSLFDPYNPQGLTRTENRMLQTTLAFAGFYNGLLDGDWGRRSQTALADYTRNRTGSGYPRNSDAADAIIEILSEWSDSGWEQQHWDVLSLSFLVPDKTLAKTGTTKLFVNFNHDTSSLSYSLGVSTVQDMRGIHSYVESQDQYRPEAYTLRKTGSWITSAKLIDGRTLYARSEFFDGIWSNILLSARPQDSGKLMAVAASSTRGKSPAIYLPEGSFLSGLVNQRLEMLFASAPPAPQTAAPIAAPPPATQSAASSGTGFYVTAAGHVLTNAHVVEDCTRITFNDAPAQLIDSSEVFDLALLQTTAPSQDAVASFATSPARLNSDVTVVGFPLSALLGGVNVTRGAVSSLKGVAGDATRLQITAPVQAGNSGGPVLAANGLVVGVVVSKLDSDTVSESFGDVPQNVNFAIRGEVAKLYLAANSLQPRIAPDAPALPPEVLADQATRFTGFIQCY